jgi:uncharacterized Tic20 family protein
VSDNPFPGPSQPLPPPPAAPTPPGYPGQAVQPGYPAQTYPGYPPPAGSAPYGQPYYAPPPTRANNNTLAIIAHLGPIAGGFIVPLVVFITAKDDPTVRAHAAEALNFQITFTAVMVVSMFSFFAAMAVDIRAGFVLFAFVWLAMMTLGIFSWVVAIIAMVKASRGELFHYPLTVRLVKP